MSGLLLIDASNLVFSTILEYHSRTGSTMDLTLVRNLILDRLVQHKNKLKHYDEILMCFDGMKYWRRGIFPYYKGKRKDQREKDSFDWDNFFPLYDEFKRELRENFPVKCLEVEGAEADDIIATLCMVYGTQRDICILSSDKDFIQVQQHICPRIKQWSIFHSKFLTPKNAKYDLLEHIIKGDTDDGVPNILSPDDTLMDPEKRQKPVRVSWLAECSKFGLAQPEKFCKTFEVLSNFKRNQKLIDLRLIPEELMSKIVNAYSEAVAVKGKVFDYYVRNRLTRLLSNGAF